MTALQDVRVLDVAGELGGYAAQMLTGLGAEVVTVEPSGGAPERRRPPFLRVAADDGPGLPYLHQRAGQRSVRLPEDGAEHEDFLAALAVGADVVLIGRRPARGLPGLGDASRPLWAPDTAIVCALSAFGTGGPRDDWRTTELVSFAASGLMWSIGTSEGPPLAIPGRALYGELGCHAAAMVVLALRERARTGGQELAISLHDLLTYRAAQAISVYHEARQEFATRHAIPDPPPAGIWQLKDGPVEVAVYQPTQWRGFFQLIGAPEHLAAEDLSNRGVRLERAEEIAATVREVFADYELDDFLEKAHRNRVPCAPLREPGELANDRQLGARDYFVKRESPDGDVFTAPGAPFLSSPLLFRADGIGPVRDLADGEEPWTMRAGAPAAGEALSRIRVLSFGTAIAGNITATMLAEMGADVVKIESPVQPDPMRNGPINPHVPRVFGADGIETNIRFASYTRSCRSVGLDMRNPEDRETFLELLGEADVVLDNFAGGVMEKWGFDRARLVEQFPGLVVATISGYGRTGPMADYRAYGANINAYTGLTKEWFEHTTQCDWTAVSHGVLAIAAALAHRDRTGLGALVDLAQTEAACAATAALLLGPLNGGAQVWAGANTVPGSVMTAVLPCAGVDEWVAVELESDVDLRAVQSLLGDVGPAAVRSELAARVAGVGAARAAEELQRIGVAASPVSRIADIYADAQLWGRGALVHVDHPDLGDTVNPAPFQHFSAWPTGIRWPSPSLGQHNDEVRKGWLARPRAR